jgi:hypothetical protein
LFYSKISVSITGVVSILSKDNLISGNGGSGPAGIAVSKLSGSTRYLYSVGAFSIKRYTISSSGIGSVLDISSWDGTYTYEVDLSNNGNYLAWGDANGDKVYVCDLTAPGYPITTYTTSLPSSGQKNVCGVEFSSDNLKLYYAIKSNSGHPSYTPNGGIFKIDRTTGIETRLTNSNNYSTTHLEIGKDGYIYAVNAGSLGKINQSTDVVSSAGLSGVTIYSNSSDAANVLSVYSLPDQIDNEDCNYFFGVDKISITGTVNSESISPTNPLMLCNASSINLNLTTSNVTSYRVRIYNSDISGSQSYEIGITPSWIASAPPSSINLKSLYSSFLSSNTGYYLMVLETQNLCKQTSFSALLNVISYPPPTSNFTFTIGSSTNVTPSTSVPGNASCQLNTNINGNGSSGFVTYYQIDIDQVNCSNGDILANIGSFYSDQILDNDPTT